MTSKLTAALLAGTVLTATLLATATPAEAQYYRRYGGYGHGYYHGGYGYRPYAGAVVGGALLGLGVGALLARPYYAPPPVVYAPPPAYYPAPYAYYPPY